MYTLAHPHSLALVLHFAAWVHWLTGKVPAMEELVAELVALASQEGFAYWAAQATMWRGLTLTAQEQHAEGIAQILQGLTARHATGASLYRASHLALLAEAIEKQDRSKRGCA